MNSTPDNTNDTLQLYFFSQDQDCHWYMIPADKRDKWNQINNMDSEDPDTWDAFNEFEEYRTGGGISHIEFYSERKGDIA